MAQSGMDSEIYDSDFKIKHEILRVNICLTMVIGFTQFSFWHKMTSHFMGT